MRKLRAIVDDGGIPLDPDLREVIEEAIGPITRGATTGCPVCGFLAVVPIGEGAVACEACTARARHRDGCAFRRAVTCPVGIACREHERDVCPICDQCDCGAVAIRNAFAVLAWLAR